MNLQSIISLINKDMEAVEEIVFNKLHTEVCMIKQLVNYIITGGKKIRPMIVILIGAALGYQGVKHINLAALVEFIHIATLLHDDVVDRSKLRRGKKTANNVFGNAASILVGDFIYTRSFQMITELNSIPILKLMSDATNVIAEGEVIQLVNCNNPDMTESSYMKIIYNKTARLFEAATHAAAIISGANKIQQKALQNYGRYFGIAFQLIDDLMDYNINKNIDKKNFADDLNIGKLTLPLLHAMKKSSLKESQLIRNAIKNGYGKSLLNNILVTMKRYGSFEYTNQRAKEEANKAVKALDFLPNSLYKEALISLLWISIRH